MYTIRSTRYVMASSNSSCNGHHGMMHTLFVEVQLLIATRIPVHYVLWAGCTSPSARVVLAWSRKDTAAGV